MKDNNFESYNLEQDDNDDVRSGTMWTIVPQIMTMPASGWERLKKAGPSPEIATFRFLVPICILAGASDFFALLYPGQYGFTGLLVNSVVSFCSFFIGFYLALVLAKIFLPSEAKEFLSSSYGKLLTMTGVGTLAFFRILMQGLPMLDFILEFLPLWTIFLIYKGMKLSDIPSEKAAYSMGVMCVTVICGPVLTEWALSLFT